MQNDSEKQHFWGRCLQKHPDHMSVDAGGRKTEPRWGRERWRKLVIPLSVVTAKGGLKVSARKTNLICCRLPEPVFMSLSKTAALQLGCLSAMMCGQNRDETPTRTQTFTSVCAGVHSTHIKYNVGTLGLLGKRSFTLHALVNSLD